MTIPSSADEDEKLETLSNVTTQKYMNQLMIRFALFSKTSRVLKGY